MKKSILFLLSIALWGMINSSYASVPTKFFLEECDACGCSASGGSMGFHSILNNNFVGVRYIHQSYKSKEGIFNNSPWAKEDFNTVQFWGRVPISKKIQLMALVPYHFNQRIKTNDTQNINGLGDVSLLGFYNLLQTQTNSIGIGHKWEIGAGVKLPTGTYNKENNGSVNPSFQLGTGSWDYTIASEYTLQYKKMGLNTTANYIIKTENNKNYQFGNQFNYGTTLFYSTAIDKMTVIPQIGILGESYEINKEWGIDVPKTQGNILFSRLGIEMGYKKFSFGTNLMLPVTQNLTGNQVEAQYRWAINLNYLL